MEKGKWRSVNNTTGKMEGIDAHVSLGRAPALVRHLNLMKKAMGYSTSRTGIFPAESMEVKIGAFLIVAGMYCTPDQG
jgi:hypothetical protein